MHSQSVYVNSNRHTRRSFSNSCLPLISFIIKYCIFLFPRLLLDYPAVHTAHGVWQVKYSAWSAGGTTTPCNEPKLNRCRNFLAALHSHAHWMIWHVHSYFTLRTFRDYFHLVAWGKINPRSHAMLSFCGGYRTSGVFCSWMYFQLQKVKSFCVCNK